MGASSERKGSGDGGGRGRWASFRRSRLIRQEQKFTSLQGSCRYRIFLSVILCTAGREGSPLIPVEIELDLSGFVPPCLTDCYIRLRVQCSIRILIH